MKYADKMLFDHKEAFRERWKPVQDQTHFTVFNSIQ